MPFAYADSADSSSFNLEIVMICALIIVVFGAMAFLAVAVSWGRRHARSDLVTAFAVLWALLAAISVGIAVIRQLDYSQERSAEVYTGYRDPLDKSDAPPLPWKTWVVLGAVYIGLLAWSSSPKGPQPAFAVASSDPPPPMPPPPTQPPPMPPPLMPPPPTNPPAEN